MDTVETRLVDTLDALAAATHADDALVDRLIRDARSADAPPRPAVSRRRAAWYTPLLAAAVVAVVAAGAVFITHRTAHHSQAPATHSPSPSPSPSVHRNRSLTCTAPLPGAWSKAASRFVRPPNSSGAGYVGLRILDVSDAGDVLAFSGARNGQVVLVGPSGSTRVLYRLPPSLEGTSTLHVGDGRLDRHWAVFDIIAGGGEGVEAEIDAVNLSTGATRGVRPPSPHSTAIVTAPQLLDGHVYWSETDASGTGSVYAYDLSRGTRTRLDHGQVDGPQLVGGAIEWTRGSTVVWHGSPDLPAGFQVTARGTGTLVQDGDGSAWTAWSGSGRTQQLEIYYEKRGTSSPVTIYRPPNADVYPTVLGVSGPYVLLDDSRDVVVLDTRTAAAAALARDQDAVTTAAAGGGVIALNRVGSLGGPQLALLTPRSLPVLRC